MLEASFIGLILLFGWIAGGSATISARKKWLNPSKSYWEDEREMGHYILGGGLWPVYLPFLTMWAIGSNKIKFLVLPKPRSAEQKVIEYSEAPTKVLAQIVAAKILAAPFGLKTGSERWESSDGKVSVKYRESNYDSSWRFISLQVNQKMVSLELSAQFIILDALKKCQKLKEDKEAADQKAAEQLAALEAVESLLLQPEKDDVS